MSKNNNNKIFIRNKKTGQWLVVGGNSGYHWTSNKSKATKFFNSRKIEIYGSIRDAEVVGGQGNEKNTR